MKICGNLKVNCRYRQGIKECLKPKEFTCKEIINGDWNKEKYPFVKEKE